jgi:hypothetical protein
VPSHALSINAVINNVDCDFSLSGELIEFRRSEQYLTELFEGGDGEDEGEDDRGNFLDYDH